MDGNGRWAKARGLPRLAGHKAGVDSVREIVRACPALGVDILTLYTFSTENWQRPAVEVGQLMGLVTTVLGRETKELGRQNVRLRILGRREGLPPRVRARLERSAAELDGNTGLQLNIAINYGSRQEIVDAVGRLLASGAREASEESFSAALYTAGLPDPDLVIRTSGEMRLSNFLLWQAAYAEFYVTDVLWPDFRRPQLEAAVAAYSRRHRRFGGSGAAVPGGGGGR